MSSLSLNAVGNLKQDVHVVALIGNGDENALVRGELAIAF